MLYGEEFWDVMEAPDPFVYKHERHEHQIFEFARKRIQNYPTLNPVVTYLQYKE